jgi:hypothetical protein
MESRASLLGLPYELLHYIINLSRPLGFEGIMLACKHTYQVGKTLIPEHNYCKNWLSATASKVGLISLEPIRLLEQLLYEPVWKQADLIVYIKCMHLEFNLLSSPMCSELVLRAEQEAPWLLKDLLKLRDTFPEIEQHVGGEERVPVNVEPAVDTQVQLHETTRRDSNPNFFNLSTLLLFSNLQQLSLNVMPELASNEFSLLYFINADQGRTYFPQLEQLRLGKLAVSTLDDISVWLLLPKLKAILVCDLRTGDSFPYGRTPLSYDRPLGQHKSKLEHLMLVEANYRTDLVGKFLESLQSLRTFVWEDGMIPPDLHQISDTRQGEPDNHPDAQRRPVIRADSSLHCSRWPWNTQLQRTDDETLTCPVRDQDGAANASPLQMKHLITEYSPDVVAASANKTAKQLQDEIWEPLYDYDSDEADGDVEDDSIRPSSVSEKGFARLFKPSELLRHLSPSHLEHLVLTQNPWNRSFILRQHQIVDLKAFTKLAYLELDVQILRPIRGNLPDIPPKCVPRSLSKILPASIKVVRLTVRHGRFQYIHKLLKKLPLAKAKFPDLRLIVVRFAECGSPYETLTRIRPLQNQLEQVGVKLSMKQFTYQERWKKTPVSIGRDGDPNGLSEKFFSYSVLPYTPF